MNKTCEIVWADCLNIIKDIVEWQHYKTWFEPIKPVSLKNKVLTIQVPSQFFYEYIEEHYITLIAKTIKRELGKEARLALRAQAGSFARLGAERVGFSVFVRGLLKARPPSLC